MILRAIQLVCLAAGVLLGVSCSSMTVKVEGTAMMPGFKDGDKVVVKNDAGPIERSDVILFRYPKDPSQNYIKRVIGLPGETIAIVNGKTMIDGKELAEPYVLPANNGTSRDMPARQIPPDNYFVMGDNRDKSSDSRTWGYVTKDLIVGKCFLSN